MTTRGGPVEDGGSCLDEEINAKVRAEGVTPGSGVEAWAGRMALRAR